MTKQDILVALTTYGSAPYIDLSLTAYERQSSPCVIVVDDGSRSTALRDVCKKHRVPLLNTNSRPDASKTNGIGDVLSTCAAIRTAYALGYGYVVKQSRRWICKDDPIPSLVDVFTKSDAATAASYTTTYGFGFRTEFFAMRVKEWMTVVDEIEDTALNNPKKVGLVEAFIHKYAKSLEPNSEQYNAYKKELNLPPSKAGYALWNFVGTDKKNPPSNIIWHDRDNTTVYANYAKELGLLYTVADFNKVNK